MLINPDNHKYKQILLHAGILPAMGSGVDDIKSGTNFGVVTNKQEVCFNKGLDMALLSCNILTNLQKVVYYNIFKQGNAWKEEKINVFIYTRNSNFSSF